MVDINTIKAKGRTIYSERQAFFPMDFNFLLRRQTGLFQCAYCGTFITDKYLSRDHVYPKSKGGNVTTACCAECNEKKKNMLPLEWALHASQHQLDFNFGLFRQIDAKIGPKVKTSRRINNKPP